MDSDREDFLKRLAKATHGDRAFVYAWTLIPNHFHLAIRTGTQKLATVMSRLMTGYSVSFNRRYKRHGHLFQNRYKSTVVDDEAYLLGLVRYIHLNPLRAGIVRSIGALARFRWSGHAALMGQVDNNFQDVDEILGRFGKKAGSARQSLVEFMSDVKKAKNEEHLFKGGGLIRSAGGMQNLLKMPKEERQMYDERILGDGQFVEAVLEKAEPRCMAAVAGDPKNEQRFAAVQEEICRRLKVGIDSMSSGSRARQVVRARDMLAYLAGRYLGWSGRRLSQKLGISPASVSQGMLRGAREIDELGWELDGLLK